MKLHHLRDFLAVVERGSVHGAARSLGISQPVLSRSIQNLETEVGAPLFERHSRGATLTPMGRLFAERARAAVGELRKAKEEIAQMQGAVSGTVVVCLSTPSLLLLWPETLIPFRRRYPDIQLQVVENTYPVIESKVRNGEIDFFVGAMAGKQAAEGLTAERLIHGLKRAVFARKGHPLAGARSLVELKDANWVSVSIMKDPRDEFRHLFSQFDVLPPRLAVRAESFLTLMYALMHGDMLAVLPTYYRDVPLIRHFIQPIQIEEEFGCPDLKLVRRAAVPLTPAAEHLADLMRRAAAHSCAA